MKAVLFDMDGTLTDSEKLWTLTLQEVAADLGGVLSEEGRAATVGQSIPRAIELLHADLGLDGDLTATADLVRAKMAVHFANDLPWRDGAEQLLAEVRAAGLKTALVTATERPMLDGAMNTLGHNSFDVIVAGDEVDHPKPHPEPYLRALAALGLGVHEAVAVEDSPTGAASAAAAGLTVLVVPCEVPVEPGERRVFAESLLDVDLAHLRALPRPSAPTAANW